MAQSTASSCEKLPVIWPLVVMRSRMPGADSTTPSTTIAMRAVDIRGGAFAEIAGRAGL